MTSVRCVEAAQHMCTQIKVVDRMGKIGSRKANLAAFVRFINDVAKKPTKAE